jgi:hypothetical protein
VETKEHLYFLKEVGGVVGVYMEPRGRWTEKVWEPLLYSVINLSFSINCHFSSQILLNIISITQSVWWLDNMGKNLCSG